MMSGDAIHPDTHIGHVHLKVADLDRAVKFYRDVFGFEAQQYFGRSAAFLSAGGYHHHIGLNVWESRGGSPPPYGTTGLYHFAILFANRRELARALKRLLDLDVPIDGAADHGVSEAIYLRDPDGNGIEIYVDRDPSEWPRDGNGELRMVTEPLDFDSLMAELKDEG